MFKKPNTVPTPDDYYDIAMRVCTPSEFMILGVVIRQTFGFNKYWDYISLAQFEHKTAISSNTTILKCLNSLESKGWIQSAYICGECGTMIEKIERGKKEKVKGGKWDKKPKSLCPICGNHEMPQKWFAARIEGLDLWQHLDSIGSALTQRVPGGVIQNLNKGVIQNLNKGVIQNLNIQETTIQETKNSLVAEKNSDDNDGCIGITKQSNQGNDNVRKYNFQTYRRRLKGEKLQIFDLVAGNIENQTQIDIQTITGKTLLEFVNQSPEAVKSAYKEMVDRDKKHFNYFTKVFFSQLQKTTQGDNHDNAKSNQRLRLMAKSSKDNEYDATKRLLEKLK